MSVTASPGSTFPATLEGAPTGLAGTLGVRIENLDGTTQTARTTVGIVEIEPGSGIYTKADMLAPAERGDYLIVWDDGAIVPTFVSEPLTVSGYSSAGLSPEALIDIGTLSAFLDEPIADGDPTTFAIGLINGYSKAISRYTGRQFIPQTPALDTDDPVTHRFTYDGSGYLSLEPWELRSLGGVGYGGTGAVTLYADRTLDGRQLLDTGTDTVAADYRLDPPNGTDEGTYLWLRLPVPDRRGSLGDEVTVSGYWGAGVVPDDVGLACLLACEHEWRAESRRATGGPPLDEGEPFAGPEDRAGFWLPFEARSLLDQFKRDTVRV